ncbi:alpha/beta hydrolase [Stigmatella hybrida]|uniref:alpha/beta hydrolase n=1 Tax=Stigmatella hybrida TaxID=394097 RepID=UPI001CDA561D|nr:alpha/beta hydrolase [Stigmatella hybrida]
MFFHTSRLSLAGVPALTVHAGPREDALQRGVVLFFHGLGGSKEVHERELQRFAERGLFAVGVDAVGHGERRFPDFDERLNQGHPHFHGEFLNVIHGSAHEVPALLDTLVTHHGANPARLSVGGVSLGGFITYGALLAERRLHAAVPLLGSPLWDDALPHSPHRHPERLFPVALFSQTAGLDEVVSLQGAREFHARLEPLYASSPGRLRYREFPQSAHMMRPEDWEEAIGDAADWLVRP